MLDIQAVYIHDFVPLQDLELVGVLRIAAGTPARAAELANTTEVSINDGTPSRFFTGPGGDLFVSIPPNVFVSRSTALVMTSNIEGHVDLSVRLTRLVKNTDGAVVDTVVELLGPNDVTVTSSTLRLYGTDFSSAVKVLVNGIPVGFTVLDKGTLLCGLPPNVSGIRTVEVIASVNKITGTSGFSFMLGADMSTTKGMDKLVGQFIKGLMTSKGSDSFRPDFGGDMQKWAGSFSRENGLAAKAIIQVIGLAGQLTAGQVAAGLPYDETLAYAEVTNFTTSMADPSVAEISLRLHNLAGEISSINLLVGAAGQTAQQMSSGASNVG